MKSGAHKAECQAGVRYRGDAPEVHAKALRVGILTKAATPEGDYVELIAPSYERQPVSFADFSPFSRAALNTIEVKFVGIEPWPAEVFLGIFLSDSSLLAWGRIGQWLSTTIELGEIYFPPGSIRLRFS